MHGIDGRLGWLEHWTNGGTAITKFSPADRLLYERAIAESGDRDFYIQGDELHCRRPVLPSGISPFWRVFEKVRAELRAEK